MRERSEERNGDRLAVPRRRFCQVAATGLGGLLLSQYPPEVHAASRARRPLPPPRATGRSTALCLNSRASEHYHLLFTATAQQLSNVLWAAGRAPVTGSFRTIYVATSNGTFIYHPEDHSLEDHSTDTVNHAFRITYDRERDFDAGVSYMTALLASVALWTGTPDQLASCPQGTDLNFGIRSVAGHTDQLVAGSSDGSLLPPKTTGTDVIEETLRTLALTHRFRPGWRLTPRQLSQILWAGYGPTPHTVYLDHAGLTAPSAFAGYFLTRKIYVVGEQVLRYASRVGTDLFTHDHRVEVVQNADLRIDFRRAVPSLPAAPCYVVLCLAGESLDKWYRWLEAGFVAGNILMQAAALELGCAFESEVPPGQYQPIQQLLQLPGDDHPIAAVAVGKPL